MPQNGAGDVTQVLRRREGDPDEIAFRCDTCDLLVLLCLRPAAQDPCGGRIVNNGSKAVEATLPVSHFTDTLLLMASPPVTANVQSLTVLPTTMPFVGRG
ncbi:hypothetical protein ACIOML_34240 [Streptomyces anulatus]